MSDELSREVGVEERAALEAKQARERRIRLAREDPDAFIEFAGRRDDDPTVPLRQSEIQSDFQEIFTSFPRAILMTFPESGKTTNVVYRIVWELGNNPDLRIVILSKVAKATGTGSKIANQVKKIIETSAEVAEVFPNLVPGSKWSETMFTVRRESVSKDPSVYVLGSYGAITGARIDLLVIDDLIDATNTRNKSERDKLQKWMESSVFERLSVNARVWFLCNAWHPKDLAHVLAKRNFTLFKYVVEKGGVPTWPEVWPMSRIVAKKKSGDLTPMEFARAFHCVARDDSEATFEYDAIQRTYERGEHYEYVYDVDFSEIYQNGCAIFTGVDLAVRKKKNAHFTSFVTILVRPDGHRQVLWIMKERLHSEEIAREILDHNDRYGSVFIVENNAAQDWIFDIVRLVREKLILQGEEVGDLPTMIPFTTGKQKVHPELGLNGLAVEISNDMWTVPKHGKCTKEGAELKEAFEAYTLEEHTPDELMATWFSREGARRIKMKRKAENEEKRRRGIYTL